MTHVTWESYSLFSYVLECPYDTWSYEVKQLDSFFKLKFAVKSGYLSPGLLSSPLKIWYVEECISF